MVRSFSARIPSGSLFVGCGQRTFRVHRLGAERCTVTVSGALPSHPCSQRSSPCSAIRFPSSSLVASGHPAWVGEQPLRLRCRNPEQVRRFSSAALYRARPVESLLSPLCLFRFCATPVRVVPTRAALLATPCEQRSPLGPWRPVRRCAPRPARPRGHRRHKCTPDGPPGGAPPARSVFLSVPLFVSFSGPSILNFWPLF